MPSEEEIEIAVSAIDILMSKGGFDDLTEKELADVTKELLSVGSTPEQFKAAGGGGFVNQGPSTEQLVAQRAQQGLGPTFTAPSEGGFLNIPLNNQSQSTAFGASKKAGFKGLQRFNTAPDAVRAAKRTGGR